MFSGKESPCGIYPHWTGLIALSVRTAGLLSSALYKTYFVSIDLFVTVSKNELVRNQSFSEYIVHLSLDFLKMFI